MIVLSRPSPNIKVLLSNGRPFDKPKNSFYFDLGRQALLFAILSLGVKKGDLIAVPAYICNSTIQPLKDYGIFIHFLDVENDLSISTGNVKNAINSHNIKAVLLVHFFGFYQDVGKILNICSAQGVKVIEDASHGFLLDFFSNGDSIKGDAIIYSIRKTLPVKDGGVVRFDSKLEKKTIVECIKCSSYIDDIKYLTIRCVEILATKMGVNIYKTSFTKVKNFARRSSQMSKYFLNITPCAPSYQLGKYLANDQYLRSVKTHIRSNYINLDIQLKALGFKLLFDHPEGNIPQCIVIFDEKGGLHNYLRDCGVGAWRWPFEEIPEEVLKNATRYPKTILFDKRLVMLPVHQSLDKSRIDYIIKILSKWNGL